MNERQPRNRALAPSSIIESLILMPPLVASSDAPLAARPPSDLSALQLDQAPAAVYLASLAHGSRRTMQQALTTIASLVGSYDALSCPWPRMRFQHTAAIRSALEARYAPATANKMLCALRGVLEACWNLDLMSVEDYRRAASVKAIKAERVPKGRALSRAEIIALLEACARDTSPAGVRDAALIALMAQGGPRRSEVAALQLADYTRTSGALRVLGKGNKERIVYLTGGAQTMLHDWLTLRGDEAGALFTATTRSNLEAMTDQAVLVILAKRAKEAQVEAFSPHDLRRTMITTLLAEGADVISVQRLAGHADPKTTARYDRRGEDAKRDAAALFDLPVVPSAHRRTLPLDD